MKTMRNNLLAALLVFSCLTGCAFIRQTDAPMKENMLVSTGFKARPANTAKRQADLASLTPYRIQMKTHKGKTVYIYPDPKKQMVYVGGPNEYAAYKKLSRQEDAIAEQRMNDMEWNYYASTYGYGFAGNAMVFY